MTEARESSTAKGDRLERAVAGIESIILRADPGYAKDRFRIHSKKILAEAGVHHEIDVFVEIDHGPGYDAVFIFECKNWTDKVSKNDIIVFAEKIRASRAQRGFFVAQSYTKDAVAQAAQDPRMVLLYAQDLNPEETATPFSFHWVNVQVLEVAPRIRGNDPTLAAGAVAKSSIDPANAVLVLQGKPLDIRGYFTEWAYAAAQEETNKIPTADRPAGHYDYETTRTRTFPIGALTLGGKTVAAIDVAIRYQVQVLRPVVSSHVSVDGRGRVVETSPVRLFGKDLRVAFAAGEGMQFGAMRLIADKPKD